ncbi:M3 family metallopeptidase [Nitratifractor salsuginis]|uniref:oligopeptidase A n=1 Tax=Nitratifractor salsuginis (strain DSM 16511 / JCM 12458 / E9I37-1) TaxID=749222 RepID=E6WYG8_NITSE|nr:M3 family metallopeptidase [Nitratifractor salsuginis]ADV46480.1 oligopeptidase A [Nitratifractor salsuginis DSM 16511]
MFQTFTLKDQELNDFPQRLEELLKRHKEAINTLAASESDGYEAVLKPMEDLDEERSLFFTPLSHLNSVLNSEATQKAYEASLPLLSRFHSEIAQNEALYTKLKRLQARTPEQRKVLENEIRDFRLSGAELPLDKKKELESIDLELSELSNRFSQNLLDATKAYELIIEDPEDVAGIPESDLAAARFEEDGKVQWRFTLQIPSYLAYMTYGPNRQLREELYRAYTTRAPENAQVIDRILELRQQKAKLLGFDNYAEYALQTRDARDEWEVTDFLEKLTELSLPQGRAELEELRRFARELDGIEDLASYDVAYYGEKLKKHLYDFDESETKPYLEQQAVLNGLLQIVSELFGMRFEAMEVPRWHPSVKAYDIYRAEELSGRIYFDLEARKEKRGGAWMHDWETRFIDSRGEDHLPSAFVVANFPPASEDQPSLLRHDDVVTLFHEMGHAIHHLFSRVPERSVSGINGVAWDVVEFPSQFLENFAYEAPILRRFARHYQTGEAMPEELLAKIKAAKNFQAALGMLRQLEFALFDFKLHQRLYQGDEVQELLDWVREKTALLKPPAYNRFQHGFAHIFAGGYAAGYYSYKWAEVLSADAFFACLDPEGNFDRKMAQGYYEHILSRGGSEEMSSLYQQWLGRKARLESLIRLYGME